MSRGTKSSSKPSCAVLLGRSRKRGDYTSVMARNGESAVAPLSQEAPSSGLPKGAVHIRGADGQDLARGRRRGPPRAGQRRAQSSSLKWKHRLRSSSGSQCKDVSQQNFEWCKDTLSQNSWRESAIKEHLSNVLFVRFVYPRIQC